MVMANLASIFLSLPSHQNVTATSTIATQIQLLAIANTSLQDQNDTVMSHAL